MAGQGRLKQERLLVLARDLQRARMKVKAISNALGHFAAGHVLVVAKDGCAKLMHMEAQLVHTARLRTKRDPGSFLACLRDGDIVSDRVARAFIILGTLDHAFAATADTAVTSILLCNLTAEDANIDIYLLPNDGSTTVPTENNKIYNTLTIQAKDTYIIDTEKMILSNGDKIYVQNADSTGQVIVTVSTIGL